MPTLSQLAGLNNNTLLAPKLSRPFFESGTMIAPNNGLIEIRAMSAGGAGATKGVGATGTATGGYSGAWGAKIVRVGKGDSIVVVIGSGSAGAGGAVSVTVKGVSYTLAGGQAGVYQATGTPVLPSVPALPTTWDIGAVSVQPGIFVGGTTGGAGVDILAQGNNATSSASANMSGGGGTGYPGTTTGDGGGALPGGMSTRGTGPTTPGEFLDSSSGEWIISFYGGSGSSRGINNTALNKGGNGGGGGGGGNSAGYQVAAPGGNGGGGGAGNASLGGGAGGVGGRGAGGGAGTTPVAFGGDAYACIHFMADLEV